VPTRELDAASYCPAGVVSIEEEQTLPDGLIELATIGIWGPRTATFECRADAHTGGAQ
jgi:hypothetical protein